MYANFPHSECPCCGEPLNGVMIDESESKKDAREIAQSFEINLVGEADLDEAVGLLHCLCLSHNSCGSDLDESCQFFDPDEGRCKLRGCPGAWDI